MKFGPYELVDRIAKGELSDVFIARMLLDDLARSVALKRFDAAFCEEERFTKILLEEARMASRLEHPNIAGVYDYGIIDGSCYLATELVDGVDAGYLVEEMARRGEPIPPEVALGISLAACDALAYAHGWRKSDAPLGVVHRGVSPRNIMVSLAGNVKLTDFGVVRARRYLREVITDLSRDECGYLSPEEVQGESVDGRSDIFSLATVLHELLTGVPLFCGASSVSTVQRLLRAEIPPPSRGNPDVAPQLDLILLKALSRDVSTRYQTAESLRADLYAYALNTSMVIQTADLGAWIRGHFAESHDSPKGALARGTRARTRSARAAAFVSADERTDTEIDGVMPSARAAPRRKKRSTLSLDDDVSTTRRQHKRFREFGEAFERSTVRNVKMANQPVRDDSAVTDSQQPDLTEPTHTGATPPGYIYQDTVVGRPPFEDVAEDTAVGRGEEDSVTAPRRQRAADEQAITRPKVGSRPDLATTLQDEDSLTPSVPIGSIPLGETERELPALDPPRPLDVRQGEATSDKVGPLVAASSPVAIPTATLYEDEVPTTHRRRGPASSDLRSTVEELPPAGEDLPTGEERRTDVFVQHDRGSTGSTVLAPVESAAEAAPSSELGAETEARTARRWRWVGLGLILLMLAAGAAGAIFLVKYRGQQARKTGSPEQVVSSPK